MAATSSSKRRQGGRGGKRKTAATGDDEDAWLSSEDECDDSHLTDSTRKLASVQLVTQVTRHPNADALAIAEVLGWKVIVRLDEVAAGDRIVFCEIDSCLPAAATWLPPAVQTRVRADPNCTLFRVKTIRLRELPSQGLIIPMSLLPDTVAAQPVGTDVTAELGITKYQPNAVRHRSRRDAFDRSGVPRPVATPFPTHLLAKSDETRIQSAPWLLNLVGAGGADAASSSDSAAPSGFAPGSYGYYITMKMDGTSATFLNDPARGWTVCSRNRVVAEPALLPLRAEFAGKPPRYPCKEYAHYFPSPDAGTRYDYCVYHLAARKYAIRERLAAHGGAVALQGEIVGPHIQKNLLNSTTVELYIFNVVRLGPDRATLSYAESQKVLDQLNAAAPDAPKLQLVPLVEHGDEWPVRDIPQLVELSKGLYPGTKNHREGLVVRFFDSATQAVRRSFKVINVDYLLAHD